MCTPYTFKRRAAWYLRLRVPPDLTCIFPSHIVRTLETRELRIARHRALRAATIAPAAWLEARQMAMNFLGKQISDLTADDVIAAKSKLGAELEKLDAEAKKAIKHRMYEIFSSAMIARDDTKSKLSAIQETVDIFAQVAAKAKIEGMREAMTLLGAGQISQIRQPEPIVEVSSIKEIVAWDSLIDKFHKFNATSEKTIANYKTAFDKLRVVIGSKYINQITKKDIEDYVDYLINYRGNARNGKDSYSRKTIDKTLSQIKLFMTWAHEKDYTTFNPTERVNLPKQSKQERDEEEDREAFTTEDLAKIFSSPIYTGCFSDYYRSRKGSNIYKNEYDYFLLCALLTGGRVDELANASSRIFDLDGIPCLDLRNGTKTKNAPRIVPLMKELIETGFLKFAENQANKCDLMFSNASSDWSKWGNRYIDDVLGKTRYEICMHSFRHNFKQIEDAAEGLSENVARKIFGHSPKDVNQGYGKTLTANEARVFLKLVQSPIDLNKYLR